MYIINFSRQSLEDIKRLKKSEISGFIKLEKLLEELQQHPYSGTGKPEQLKHQQKGLWSRRINQKHRLIYSIDDHVITVNILSAMGHYADK